MSSTPDLSRWTRTGTYVERDDGAREHVLVGRHRFAAESTLRARPVVAAPSSGEVVARAEGEPPPPLAAVAETPAGLVVEGVASSTSVDSYGTEMSLEGLRRMAEQMIRGVPMLPRHNNGTRAVEWDEVIGKTIGAKISNASVAAPGGTKEPGYTLALTSMLYADEPLAASLVRRLERGEAIGQSIGGWFLAVRVVERNGEVERVIVDEVELDHVAVTRAPANPDALGMASLRSSLDAALREAPSTRAEVTVEVETGEEMDEEVSGEEAPEPVEEAEIDGASCPVATSDVTVNLANRQKAIDKANYGPANPNDPGDYWKQKAGRMGDDATEEQVSAMRCANCSYFNVSARMKACIEAGIGEESAEVVALAGLGYCEAFDFKCASARSCDGWVVGGPITEEEAPVEEANHGDSELDPDASRADPIYVHVGDFVRFTYEDVSTSGRVTEIVEGEVDGVVGSASDPAIKIQIFDAVEDGYRPSEQSATRLSSEVEIVDDLPLPSSDNPKDVDLIVEYAERDVVSFSDFPPAPRDEPWEWTPEVEDAILGEPPDWALYEKMHLYVDPEQRETKAGYKMPIAMPYDGSPHVYHHALVAAMAVLNGARGGVDLSVEDRLGVYENLVQYYMIFEEEAPPLAERSTDLSDTVATMLDQILDEIRSSVVGGRVSVRSAPPGLDMTAKLEHDTLNHASGFPVRVEAGTGSLRSAPPPYEELPMNETDLKQLIERAVEARLASGVAPASTPKDDATVLRERVALLEGVVTRMSSGPIRRGLAYQTTDTTAGPIRGRSVLHDLVERSRSANPVVAQVAEAALSIVAGDKAERASASELTSSLASVLRAAEAEGLLGNPHPAHWG